MQRHVARYAVVRYGVAVVCVTATVILAVWLRPIALASAPLLLVAVLITGWVSGLRPALVAWALATLAFAYVCGSWRRRCRRSWPIVLCCSKCSSTS